MDFNGDRKLNLEIPVTLETSTKHSLDVSVEKDRRISMKILKLDKLSLRKSLLRRSEKRTSL